MAGGFVHTFVFHFGIQERTNVQIWHGLKPPTVGFGHPAFGFHVQAREDRSSDPVLACETVSRIRGWFVDS